MEKELLLDTPIATLGTNQEAEGCEDGASQQMPSAQPSTPAPHDSGDLNRPFTGVPQESSQGKPQLVHLGNGLFVEKLCIEEDAASVEGPSTPDAEEGAKVSMPATKRQRIGQVSPSALVSHFARSLFTV